MLIMNATLPGTFYVTDLFLEKKPVSHFKSKITSFWFWTPASRFEDNTSFSMWIFLINCDPWNIIHYVICRLRSSTGQCVWDLVHSSHLRGKHFIESSLLVVSTNIPWCVDYIYTNSLDVHVICTSLYDSLPSLTTRIYSYMHDC